MWIRFTGTLYHRNCAQHIEDYIEYSDTCTRSDEIWEEEAKCWLENTNDFASFADLNDLARYECGYELDVLLPDDVKKLKIKECERKIEYLVHKLRRLKELKGK